MELARGVFSICIVFGLLGALLWLGKRLDWVSVVTRSTRRNGVQRMELIETLRVGPQQVIHMIRIDGRVLVVALHGTGCTVIGESLGEKDEAASGS